MPATRSIPAALLLVASLLAAPALAQFKFDPGIGGGFSIPGAAVDDADLVKLSARFTAATADQPAMVAVTADVADGYHISSLTQAPGGPQKTVLRLDTSSGVRLVGPWVADPAPKSHVDTEIWEGLTLEEHYGTVTWRAPVELPAGVDPAALAVTGSADMQACQDSCVSLDGVAFEARLAPPGSIPPIASQPPAAASTGGPTATDLTASGAPFMEAESVTTSLPVLLGAAFLGGLILNLMPCVLPVIGLKVLSFAEQAGHDRGKVLAMNLAYTAGILIVFMVLAALAAFASYGWGELYTITEFKVGMIVLVFAMALSFLGVWEIPLPGFAGGKGANNLQQQEGYLGAFFKGIFTTILATPCSGPFLGSAIGYTLTQPPTITFMIFAAIGLGMSSPYLLIGAFPNLVNVLPKPGAWMETFKQLMGFVLMATVVYLISTVSGDHYLPVLATLVAVGFACWWIGGTPITAEPSKKTTAWLGGVGTAVLAGWLAFSYLGPSEHGLPWRDYSKSALTAAQAEGKTVLVEFTADWCLTCKLNLKRAINTDRVREVVEANGVEPLLADWTDKNDEIKATLASLGSRSIPLLAIYPAGSDRPIILRDLISEDDLLTALAQAGAVRGNETAVEMPTIEIGEATPAGTFR